MNILIINGSHRVGNTKRFSEFCMKTLSSKSHNVKLINLLDKKFEFCNGCLTCEETGECVIDDVFTKEIISDLKWADAYIFASPVYFNNITTLFKNYIDRSNCLCGYYEETQKKLGIFLVGQADQESLNSALSYLKEYADIMNMDVQDNSIMRIAREENELEVTEEIETSIKSWFV